MTDSGPYSPGTTAMPGIETLHGGPDIMVASLLTLPNSCFGLLETAFLMTPIPTGHFASCVLALTVLDQCPRHLFLIRSPWLNMLYSRHYNDMATSLNNISYYMH